MINKNFLFKKPNNIFDENNGCLITFDDGYKSIISNGLDLLNQKNIPYILFVCPSKLLSNSKDYISLFELKKLTNLKNVFIGSHSFNHIKLNDNAILCVAFILGEASGFSRAVPRVLLYHRCKDAFFFTRMPERTRASCNPWVWFIELNHIKEVILLRTCR